MSLKPRLILHIGMHKTGSTSLQRFFMRNRMILSALGIHYPKAMGADGRRLPKHNDLFHTISHEKDNRGTPHPTLGPSAARIHQVGLQLSQHPTTVLSAEGFSGPSPAFARAFAPLREAAEIRVVCFLRKQDEWVTSFYKQMVMSREVRESRTFEEFIELGRTRRHLDYAALLRCWVDAVGGENIRVLIYPPRKSILVDFLEVSGLSPALRYLPFGNAIQNAGRPSSYIERVRMANAAELPIPAPETTDTDYPMISESIRRSLLASCAAGNEWVRATFRSDLATLFER